MFERFGSSDEFCFGGIMATAASSVSCVGCAALVAPFLVAVTGNE